MDEAMGDGKCALCGGKARMYCESDDAMLCWDCDARVHGANFLVARHTRALLCRSCQTPTTWNASGARLTPTVALCSRCCFGGGDGCNHDSGSLENEGEDEEVQNEKEEDDEEGDNQVVPWGLTPVAVTVTSPMASPLTSDRLTVLKRSRNDRADQSSSPAKDDEPERTLNLIGRMEFDRAKSTVGGYQQLSTKEGRHLRSRRRRKRLSALTHASVSHSHGKLTFVSTAVSSEPSLSCSSARKPLSPTE